MKPATWLLAAGRDPEHYHSGWDGVLPRCGRRDVARARVSFDRYSSGSGTRKTTFRSPSNPRPTAAHGPSVNPPPMTSMLQSS
jgi:hypothetical protein